MKQTMYTEHLQNVRAGWVFAGWAVAAAVSSLLYLALFSFGLIGQDAVTEVLWVAVVVAIGFWAGGFFIGTRAIDAPILHGIGIGLVSVLAWFVLNLIVGLAFGRMAWAGLTATVAAALLLEQLAAAAAGAWVGRRYALRGGTEPVA